MPGYLLPLLEDDTVISWLTWKPCLIDPVLPLTVFEDGLDTEVLGIGR
jgi:hypothetical protein